MDIMMLFALRRGDTIPRHELVDADADVGERTIDVQINRSAAQIEDDPAKPVYLQTVRGIGYRLSVDYKHAFLACPNRAGWTR